MSGDFARFFLAPHHARRRHCPWARRHPVRPFFLPAHLVLTEPASPSANIAGPGWQALSPLGSLGPARICKSSGKVHHVSKIGKFRVITVRSVIFENMRNSPRLGEIGEIDGTFAPNMGETCPKRGELAAISVWRSVAARLHGSVAARHASFAVATQRRLGSRSATVFGIYHVDLERLAPVQRKSHTSA